MLLTVRHGIVVFGLALAMMSSISLAAGDRLVLTGPVTLHYLFFRIKRLNFMKKFLVMLAFVFLTTTASALEIRPYAAADFSAAQQAGQAVALHFHADWCPTCLAQQRSIFALRQQGGPAVTIFVAKYDDEKALRKKHRVVTQSTLIVFKGYKETGRVTGVTSLQAIAGVLDTAR